MIRIQWLALFAFLLFSSFGRSSHIIGGDLTWTCQGGSYVFKLTYYRDCNGAIGNTGFVTVKIWNHPSLNSIQLNFLSQEDISPEGTEVPGGPECLECGVGDGAGNGHGAIEKIVYLSNPVVLVGTPPAQGWIFTYEDATRSHDVTNLQNPQNAGISIIAKMFTNGGQSGSCSDNSPQFLQHPFFVLCTGDPYLSNMNIVDYDLDSLHFSFGIPFDNFSPATYNPGISPAPINFVTGYSANSPTPGTVFDPGNIPAQINSSNGNITFLSNTPGGFNLKIVARSFRNGQLIAEVSREFLVVVSDACLGLNNAPVINGPFGGLFETTVNAGDVVNFTLNATDPEFLQDGSPQRNTLSASGLNFGTNYILPNGCPFPPCATLNATPPITAQQGASTTFNWQTDCSHLITTSGIEDDYIPYQFIFYAQDDYCPIPKTNVATITVNIVNPGVISAPNINCIQSNNSGAVTLFWDAVVDPIGTFNGYQIYSLENGLEATINNIATTTYTEPGISIQKNYYLAVASGCNGTVLKYSDTISNIYLNLINPSDGRAILQWNKPVNPRLSSMGSYFHIYREYPTGTWTLYDSVPYAVTNYIDTIDICETFLNYQIVLPNDPCDFTSNISGDDFEDMMTPDIPIISYLTIDTLTNIVTISWDENAHDDTYGYVIYSMNTNGVLIEIDTVWGQMNTSYSHNPTLNGPLTYSVAAFDSCQTAIVPPTFQTSAKGEIHTSMFLRATPNICTETIKLNWSEYIGWNDLSAYEIWQKKENGFWYFVSETTTLSRIININPDSLYCFAIRAVSSSGNASFSNSVCLTVPLPSLPAFNYLQVATVENDSITLRHFIDPSVTVSEIALQRKNKVGNFIDIARIPVIGNQLSYIDGNVNVHKESYTYRVQVIDSCGRPSSVSNEAQSILLYLSGDELRKKNYLSWTNYRQFDGSILGYSVHRIIDGQLEPGPIDHISMGQLYMEDDINNVLTRGKICYYVEAIESTNTYSFAEISRSNIECITLPPLIFIPNAFVPDGVNKVFYPIISDFDPEYYDFTIFDRWGQVIFQTNDASEGWSGLISFSGEMANTGVYLYMIKLRDGDGIEIIKRGHVSLLK